MVIGFKLNTNKHFLNFFMFLYYRGTFCITNSSLTVALALGRHHTLCWDPVSRLLVVPHIHRGTGHQISRHNRDSSHFQLEHLPDGIVHRSTMHLIQKQPAHPHHVPPIITTGEMQAFVIFFLYCLFFLLFVVFFHIALPLRPCHSLGSQTPALNVHTVMEVPSCQSYFTSVLCSSFLRPKWSPLYYNLRSRLQLNFWFSTYLDAN
jgi:hypothetical protein